MQQRGRILPQEIGKPVVRQYVEDEVGVDAAAAPHAHPAVVAGRVAARVFQRRPAVFEEQPVLRVGQLRLARGHPEELRVEVTGAVQGGRGGDVPLGLVAGDREPDHRLPPGQQVLPQPLGVVGAGDPAGQSDHRDPVEAVVRRGVHRCAPL